MFKFLQALLDIPYPPIGDIEMIDHLILDVKIGLVWWVADQDGLESRLFMWSAVVNVWSMMDAILLSDMEALNPTTQMAGVNAPYFLIGAATARTPRL